MHNRPIGGLGAWKALAFLPIHIQIKKKPWAVLSEFVVVTQGDINAQGCIDTIFKIKILTFLLIDFMSSFFHLGKLNLFTEK